MTFEEYSQNAYATAVYPNKGNNIVYPVLGLSGESGEVAEKIKKLLRDKNGIMTDSYKEEVIKELGDVLWYINACAYELKIPLTEIAEKNIEKLYKRRAENTIHGSGDNR